MVRCQNNEDRNNGYLYSLCKQNCPKNVLAEHDNGFKKFTFNFIQQWMQKAEYLGGVFVIPVAVDLFQWLHGFAAMFWRQTVAAQTSRSRASLPDVPTKECCPLRPEVPLERKARGSLGRGPGTPAAPRAGDKDGRCRKPASQSTAMLIAGPVAGQWCIAHLPESINKTVICLYVRHLFKNFFHPSHFMNYFCLPTIV